MSVKDHFNVQISSPDWVGNLYYYVLDYQDDSDSIPTLEPCKLFTLHWNQIFEFPEADFKNLYHINNVGKKLEVPIFRQIGKEKFSKDL